MLMGLVYFKWVFLTFLIIHTSVIPSNTKYVLLFVGFEILLSFSGFWSAFKDYILVAVGAFFTLNRKIAAKAYIATLLTVAITFFIFVVWSASKGKYRAYLTGGQRSQNVVQSDQLNNIAVLWDIVSEDFSSENFSESFDRGRDALIYRISYVEYFALALKQVPIFIPHENGTTACAPLPADPLPRDRHPPTRGHSQHHETHLQKGVGRPQAQTAPTQERGAHQEPETQGQDAAFAELHGDGDGFPGKRTQISSGAHHGLSHQERPQPHVSRALERV
jgi:hypothetical protein